MKKKKNCLGGNHLPLCVFLPSVLSSIRLSFLPSFHPSILPFGNPSVRQGANSHKYACVMSNYQLSPKLELTLQEE